MPFRTPRKLRDRNWLTDASGAAVAEFAIVSLIVIVLLLGILDLSRYAWEFNSQKAAARAGARYAAVHPPAVDTLVDFDAVSAPCSIAGGSFIGTGLISDFKCTSTSCTAETSGTCLSSGTLVSGNFTAIVNYMRQYDPRISASDVIVEYKERGMGVSGNPYGTDVSPLITVSLVGQQFKPIALRIFGVAFSMPSVSTTMTAEDMS